MVGSLVTQRVESRLARIGKAARGRPRCPAKFMLGQRQEKATEDCQQLLHSRPVLTLTAFAVLVCTPPKAQYA